MIGSEFSARGRVNFFKQADERRHELQQAAVKINQAALGEFGQEQNQDHGQHGRKVDPPQASRQFLPGQQETAGRCVDKCPESKLTHIDVAVKQIQNQNRRQEVFEGQDRGQADQDPLGQQAEAGAGGHQLKPY